MGIENDYTKQLINNFASYAGRRALGSGEALDWNQLTNVNTLDIALRSTYNSWQDSGKTQEQKAAEKRQAALDAQHNSRNDVFGNTVDTIFTDTFKGIGMAASKAANVIGDGLSYVGGKLKDFGNMVVDGVVDLAQSTGNLFKYGEFATDDNPVIIQHMLDERYEKLRIGGDGDGSITNDEECNRYMELLEKYRKALNSISKGKNQERYLTYMEHMGKLGKYIRETNPYIKGILATKTKSDNGRYQICFASLKREFLPVELSG